MSLAKNRKKTANQKMGSHFERQACVFLQQQGLKIIQTNYYAHGLGEIDIIAEHCYDKRGRQIKELVFVEVRSRHRSDYGDALQSITYAKQAKILQAAQYYLQENLTYQSWACRFDVIVFDISDDVVTNHWLPAAFGL